MIIPNWVERALKSEGHDLSKALDPKVLLSTLSSDDVGFYTYINQKIYQVLDVAIADSFIHGFSALDNGSSDLGKENSIINDSLDQQYAKDRKIEITDLYDVFDNNVRPDPQFTIKRLDSDTLGIIPVKSNGSNAAGLVVDLLTILYKEVPFDEFMESPLTLKYIDRM